MDYYGIAMLINTWLTDKPATSQSEVVLKALLTNMYCNMDFG